MAHTALDEISKNNGRFQRVESTFREIISNEHPEYKPESGRYHLYISYACPWANRCLTVLHLKGLQDVIGVSVVHPTWQKTKPEVDDHSGWVFRSPEDPPVTPLTGVGEIPCAGCIPDTVEKTSAVRELYEKSGDTAKKYSVPVLWDKTTGRIVNNESSDIIRMFNSAFSALGSGTSERELDLYPEDLRSLIDDTNQWVYASINNGVYKCGFSRSQVAYEEAVHDLYVGLDRLEDILSRQRYLCSDTRLTEADVRLYMTLVRFDEVYIVYFKKAIRDYPHIRNYLRELYQMPAFGATTQMDHIKFHYFTSHPALNPY
eukprot:gene7624-15613_t